MHRVCVLIIGIAVCAGVFAGTSAAQQKDRVERKAVEKVAPVYPELAKRMHIAGVVKMEVVVRPNGTVKSTKAVGGNPVLIQSATDAVRQWKFEPASNETIGIVELTFDPH